MLGHICLFIWWNNIVLINTDDKFRHFIYFLFYYYHFLYFPTSSLSTSGVFSNRIWFIAWQLVDIAGEKNKFIHTYIHKMFKLVSRNLLLRQMSWNICAGVPQLGWWYFRCEKKKKNNLMCNNYTHCNWNEKKKINKIYILNL